MNQLIPTSKPTETALRKLKRQEISAKLVPYVTFLLTHLALVILLFTSFFTVNPTTKIVLAILAVCCILCEMGYIIKVAIDWHKNVTTLLDIQEKQRRAEEAARLKEKEDALALEQHRNNVLLNERQRRLQNNSNGRPAAAFMPAQGNGHIQHKPGFPSFTPNAPQQPAAQFPGNSPRGPIPQFPSNNTPGQSYPPFSSNGSGENQYSPQFSTNTPPEAYSSSPHQQQGFPQFPEITPRRSFNSSPENTPQRSFSSSPHQTPQQTFSQFSDNVPQQAFPQFPNNGTPRGFPQFPSNTPQQTPHPNNGNDLNSQKRPWPTYDQRS